MQVLIRYTMNIFGCRKRSRCKIRCRPRYVVNESYIIQPSRTTRERRNLNRVSRFQIPHPVVAFGYRTFIVIVCSVNADIVHYRIVQRYGYGCFYWPRCDADDKPAQS